MKISKRALDYLKVEEKDYILWCKKNKKKDWLASSRKEFCNKIINNKLIKDKDGNIIEKDDENER